MYVLVDMNNVGRDILINVNSTPVSHWCTHPQVVINPIDGVIHSHPTGNYSIFSATDIKNIYDLYEEGGINNIHTFTTGVVTSHGSTYLLKVNDLNKFLNFGDGALSDSFDSFKNVFIQIYGVKTGNSVQKNEKNFLNMLSQVNGGNGAGLKLFKGSTSDFNSWQSKGVNYQW